MKKQEPSDPSRSGDRAARLEAELKANLRKRKDQARARAAEKPVSDEGKDR